MTDIEQAREIAIALLQGGHGTWRDGYIAACRAGSYDDEAEVQGPLLGIKIGRGMGPIATGAALIGELA